jgi:TolA-binding protein
VQLKPPIGLCSDVHTFAFERDIAAASDTPVQHQCEHCHTAAAAVATATTVNGATSPLYAQSAAQQLQQQQQQPQQQQQQLQQYELQLQQLQQQCTGAYTPTTAAPNTTSSGKAVRCASAPMHRPLPPPGYAYTPGTGYAGYTNGYKSIAGYTQGHIHTPVKHVNTAYLHAPTLQSPYCTPGAAAAYSATTGATAAAAAGVVGGSSSGAKEAWSDGYAPLQQQQSLQQQLLQQQQQQVHYYQGQAHSPVRQLRYATIATHSNRYSFNCTSARSTRTFL